MPEPISSAFTPPDLSCRGSSDDQPLPTSAPTGGSSIAPESGYASVEPAAPTEPSSPAGATLLTEKFQHDHYAFIAAATADKASGPSAPSAPASKSAASAPAPADQLNLQVGPHFEHQLTLSNIHFTTAIDLLNLNAHLGSQNDDGSHGENIGAMATAIGAELTADYKGWRLTFGLSESLGASVSSGEGRDIDADGKPERCFQVSFGPITLGECDEL
jgi:hypothetical protein